MKVGRGEGRRDRDEPRMDPSSAHKASLGGERGEEGEGSTVGALRCNRAMAADSDAEAPKRSECPLPEGKGLVCGEG